jgi:hypothetical protein
VRITQIATTYAYDTADIDCILEGLEVDELKPLLLSRIAGFGWHEKVELITRYPRQELIGEALKLFAEAGSYQAAETIERDVLVPLLSMLSPEHIRRILQVTEENGEVQGASGTPAFLVDMFDRTADLHTQTRTAWQRFLTMMSGDKGPEEWSAYPDLRGKMEAAGMWPVGEAPTT